MSTEPNLATRRRRRWIPALWVAYGAAYVLVFTLRGQTGPALVTGVLVAAVGIGLAVELRRPGHGEPHQFGWTQDERQRLIHLKSMALVGYTAVAAATATGFVSFFLSSDPPIWPMPAVLGLSAVYGAGLVVHHRRC
jgi:hypothetical protein